MEARWGVHTLVPTARFCNAVFLHDLLRFLADVVGTCYLHVEAFWKGFLERLELLAGTLRPVLGVPVVVTLLGDVNPRVRWFLPLNCFNTLDRTEMV